MQFQADVEAEQTIRDSLKHKYPDFQLIGEESYSSGSDKRFLLDKVRCASCISLPEALADAIDQRPTFIVDPIDGTVNWVGLQSVPLAGLKADAPRHLFRSSALFEPTMRYDIQVLNKLCA